MTLKGPSLHKALQDFGERLHSMCGVQLKVSNRPVEAVEDALDLCKAALGPLQDVLIEAKSKTAAAEGRVRELEARLRWAQDTATSLGQELCGLAGGKNSKVIQPEAPVSLVKAMEFCKATLAPLKEQQARHAQTRADLEAGRSALAIEKREREYLAGLLQDASTFCADLTHRFQSLGSDQAADAADTPSGQRPSRAVIEPRLSVQSTGLYRESRVASWQEDTPNCAICKQEFSMISNKKRRHHCRICGRCVCSSCSPSSVQLKGFATLERACTPCISNAQRAPEMRALTVQLAIRLNKLCGLQAPAASQLGSLAEALAFCETAVSPLEALLGSPSEHGERNEEEAIHARAEIVRLQRELGDIGARHTAMRTWARWADDSACTLRRQLENERGRDPAGVLNALSGASAGNRVEATSPQEVNSRGCEDERRRDDRFTDGLNEGSGSDASEHPRHSSFGSDANCVLVQSDGNPFGDEPTQASSPDFEAVPTISLSFDAASDLSSPRPSGSAGIDEAIHSDGNPFGEEVIINADGRASNPFSFDDQSATVVSVGEDAANPFTSGDDNGNPFECD